MDKIREKLIDWLDITNQGSVSPIQINQKLNFPVNVAKNKIWYRGNSDELSEMYKQLDTASTRFWKASSTNGMEIRKIHTGLPKLIVNALTNIIINDYNGVELSNPSDSTLQTVWDDINDKNSFDKLLAKSIKNLLVTGDGAFKICFDKGIDKDYPILEYVSGENVEYIRRHGRISEVVFYTKYTYQRKRYNFVETYGYGYINYKLYNNQGNEIKTNAIPQTEWVNSQGVKFDNTVMLAVPVIYGESEVFEEGRGESIFEGKEDAFDSLDEAWSQWMDALRAGRTKIYIPECFIPRDTTTGELIKLSAFDNRFIAVGNDMSDTAHNTIMTEQPDIPHDSYLATYITALDLCLQGLISPSTLGIDVKKLDNAEAQREKEKTTLYTRGNIIELLNNTLPKLVKAAICGYQMWHKTPINEPDVVVNFGEYANPSFESQVETVGKAKTQGIMSIEASIDELYGDSKDEQWKATEVARIKAEQGVAIEDEPAVNVDIPAEKSTSTADGTNLLNGAQISLMNVIEMTKDGRISRNEAISIITSTLGVSRENAESFIENNSEALIE